MKLVILIAILIVGSLYASESTREEVSRPVDTTGCLATGSDGGN